MKRINGFWDLDGYFYKIEDAHPENINYLYSEGLIVETDIYNHYWLKIEGEKYYFKETRHHYQELISEEIARFLGYETAEYDLAYFNGIKGVISKSFKKEDAQYISGAEILKDYYDSDPNTINEMGLREDWNNYFKEPYYSEMNNLEIIWQALEHRYKNDGRVNIAVLMSQIVDLYIFSVLISHSDRISLNWEIEEGSEIKIAPFFDNENSFFEETEVYLSTSFSDNRALPQESIRTFLSVSDAMFRDRFIAKFEELTEEAMKEIFEKVEKKIEAKIPEKQKEYILKNFCENRNNIEEVINELKRKIAK